MCKSVSLLLYLKVQMIQYSVFPEREAAPELKIYHAANSAKIDDVNDENRRCFDKITLLPNGM